MVKEIRLRDMFDPDPKTEVDDFCFFFVFNRCCHDGVRQPSLASKQGWMALKRSAEVDAFCFFSVFTCCSHSGVRQLSQVNKQGWMALKRSRRVCCLAVSASSSCSHAVVTRVRGS